MSTAVRAPLSAPEVRRVDRTDAGWAGIDYTYAWFDLDVPPLAELRRALVLVMAADPWIGGTVDHRLGTYVPVAPDAREARAADLVRADLADDVGPENVFDRLEQPLTGGRPFVVHADERRLAVRFAHSYGDGWSCIALVKHLLEQARTAEPLPPTWDTLDPRRRDRIVLASLVRRPRAVAHALRHRERYAGGAYEPAEAHVDGIDVTVARLTTPPGWMDELTAVRRSRGSQASSAAVLTVGLRQHFTAHGHAPVPGAELLYDVRSASPASARAFGNWAAGVYVRSADDHDLDAVTHSIKEVRERGLPFVAYAAGRRRAAVQTTGGRRVMAPLGAPRLTITHLNRGGPQRGMLWRPGAAHDVVSGCVPNGLETLLVGTREMEDGRLSMSVAFHPDAWPRPLVQSVLDSFVADPFGDRLGAAGRPRP